MFRAFALAIGVSLCIFGLECMVVDRFVLASQPTTQASASILDGDHDGQVQQSQFQPPEWMPWSLMSAGTVIILYSFTIPRRVAG